MADDEQPTRGTRSVVGMNRLEAFSDGVFAIAITILVLEFSVPVVTEGDGALAAVLDEWPSYLAYVISFASVGAFWLEHSAITEHMVRTDMTFTRLNLLLLMVVAFVPFPTKLIADGLGEEGSERVAVTLYGLSLLAASLMISVLWRYASRHDLIRRDLDDREMRTLTKRLDPSLVMYGLVLLIGLVIPLLAIFGYLILALYLVVPVRRSRSATT